MYSLQINSIFQGPMIILTTMVLPWWDSISLCFAVKFDMILQSKQSSQNYYFSFSVLLADIYILHFTLRKVCKSMESTSTSLVGFLLMSGNSVN